MIRKRHGLWQSFHAFNAVRDRYGVRPFFKDGEFFGVPWQVKLVTTDYTGKIEPYRACDAISVCAYRYLRLKKLPFNARNFLALCNVIGRRIDAHYMSIRAIERRIGRRRLTPLETKDGGVTVCTKRDECEVLLRAGRIAEARKARQQTETQSRFRAWDEIYKVKADVKAINCAIKAAQKSLQQREAA